MATSEVDAFAPATALIRALQDREISSVELLDLHLQRIERYNPLLNAIVVPDFDSARGAAAEADAARARGDSSPLLGLPLTIKDCIDVKGLLCTAGAEECSDRYAEADAPVVARLRAAGAIILGKTNLSPWAGDWQSCNPLYGRTNNPWSVELTPGGSTGGGAAALASGMTTLEVGSDFGGSIRVPASFCGIYGHKPSETAIPKSGHMPGSLLPNAATAMAVLGPLARSAEDLELAMDITAGPDLGEDVAWHIRIPSARHERLADFRVAVMPPIPWLPVDSEVTAAQEEVVATLRRAGVRVQEAQPEDWGDLRSFYELCLCLFAAIGSAWRSEEDRRKKIEKIKSDPDEFSRFWIRGMEAPVADYIGWHDQREQYRSTLRAFFRDWDVLIAPITLRAAFPHTDEPAPARTLDINGQDVPYDLQLVYPAIANLPGHPATAFPAGLAATGLPIGLQAIGPYLEDRTPIRFTALLAKEFGGSHPPPGYEI